MKKILILSLLLNFLGIAICGYFIYEKGGVNYLKLKLKPTENKQQPFDIYYKIQKSIYDVLPNDSNEIIFLGNSITRICEWHELFNNPKIKNRGISADVIKGVINRIDEVTSSQPQKIFLMIGINDIGNGRSTNQIFKDYQKLIKRIKTQSPNTQLYIQSIIPTFNRENNRKIIELNQKLSNLSKKINCTYINLFSLFVSHNNQLKPEFTFDGLHLNGKGYLHWKKAIEHHVNE